MQARRLRDDDVGATVEQARETTKMTRKKEERLRRRRLGVGRRLLSEAQWRVKKRQQLFRV